ncbi:MAG: hypothetical protein HFP77_04355 [Methylococcales symbiont of Iophon sp. n. MRB-2018]|nr:MAG: hypothetical protein HFP77_04355 [Methylococcales symbiont of Iophon sp. n. MRB-2018]KAF3980085.1 MAG: hypothetical protein HFP76_03865 [Methylococcales symbiont of Iophon sp. n. MRB-2018]
MKKIKLLPLLILVAFSSQTWAYGSSGGQKACKKPKFSEFTPVKLTTVSSGAEFSFKASTLTNPDSMVVSVKKQVVEVSITKKSTGFEVKGTLPDSLQNTYARIDIKASGINNCPANDGWLLKIE